MPFRVRDLASAVSHVRRADPVIGAVIERVGACRLRPARDRFQLLVKSIVSQQISTGAARTIQARIEGLAAPGELTPESLLRIGRKRLRSAGASPQKAGYLLDLAAKTESGAVRLASLGRMSDEDVIAELVQIKGVGRWTAQMFLIFGLGRLDVFPHDDLGVRAALKNLHDLTELPDQEVSHRLAEAWRPFATIGSWYCWRSLEKPAK